MRLKKIAALLVCAAAVLCSNGCAREDVQEQAPVVTESAEELKYVFLFIGDGMSYPQFQTASDYLGAMEDKDHLKALPSLEYSQRKGVLDGPIELNFMKFEETGSAVTYDSCSFAPDSASTATSIATGYKTYSSMINMDETGSVKYETIAEKIHEQLGWKIGIISSVNLNHATPAAFYAHQPSRNNYYEIGEELAESDFDYFAGGAFLFPEGMDGTKENLYEKAETAGYTVITTQADAEKVTADSGKVILVDEHLADSDAMKYEIDRKDKEWALADYVKKGIEVLDQEDGFFMMCESGKIDWACHANDAGTIVREVLAFSEAIQEAIDFAEEHKGETLILVTGDHETGGLSIGYAGTNYDTYLTNLSNQKISFQQFDFEYIAKYKEEGTSFQDAMRDVEKLFGLKMKGRSGDKLLLTDYEIERLKSAYEKSMGDFNSAEYTQEEYAMYGSYHPFSVTITHILNNKSGIDFTSYSHTGLPVAVFAEGVGAEFFDGYYDNTEIYQRIAALVGVE